MHDVRIHQTEVLSDNWYTLRKVTFDYQLKNGTWQRQSRECYDRGNGAVILLWHPVRQTVILTRQFRMPTYVNGNADGMLIEACAGLLDRDSPEECIRRETEEETGFRISRPEKVFELYMSPGSVTEILYFFLAEYDHAQRVHAGGGVEEEEEIDVLEIPLPAPWRWSVRVKSGTERRLFYCSNCGCGKTKAPAESPPAPDNVRVSCPPDLG